MATLIDTSIHHDDLLTADAEERPEPLTEAQRASDWDDDSWNRKDDESADELERLQMDRLDAVRRYGRPVCRVELWDEGRVGL
jgi:hypothetical protein